MPAADLELLPDVLAGYGIDAESIIDIPAGRMNRHWRINAAGAAYVLRRYVAERSAAAITFEHAAIAHAAGRGWPVAPPTAAADGRTTVIHADRTYALFRFMPGAPGPLHSPAHLHTKGALLARLHRDMASFPERGQRDGWGRIWEHDASSPIGNYASFTDALFAFADDHSELASKIRAARYRSLRELARLGYGDLPDTLVHFDFHSDNLLFDGGELTALLDFDSVHLDARAADIACSIANDCPEPPADIATSPPAAAAFVAGYVQQAPLEDRELRLIVPLVRAYRLWGLPRTLAAWAAGRFDEVFPRLARLLDARLPALDANGTEIEAAILRAAGAARES
jgi:homoserine kinase type II